MKQTTIQICESKSLNFVSFRETGLCDRRFHISLDRRSGISFIYDCYPTYGIGFVKPGNLPECSHCMLNIISELAQHRPEIGELFNAKPKNNS